MSNEKPTVGCAGAGILGSAIARRLIQCGFRVGVWNRDAAKVAPLVELGAQPADTPAELARSRDVVLTCVTDGGAVEAIVFGVDGVSAGGGAGKLLIDMSTSDANQTRQMAARLAEDCAMGWLDAPISGGAPAALEGRIVQIAFLHGSKVEIDLMRLMMRRLTLTGSTLRAQTPEAKARMAEAIEEKVWPFVAEGKLKPIIDSTFDLTDAAAAHTRIDHPDHIGKIVLVRD